MDIENKIQEVVINYKNNLKKAEEARKNGSIPLYKYHKDKAYIYRSKMNYWVNLLSNALDLE